MTDINIEVEEPKDVCLSRIFMCEQISNKGRKFSASSRYYPALIVKGDDLEGVAALFTENDLLKAITRADKNPEDTEELSFQFITQEDRDIIGKEYVDAAFSTISWSFILSLFLNKLLGRSFYVETSVNEEGKEDSPVKGPG